MKSCRIFLIAIIISFGISVSVNAALTTIGTANYLGSNYNLIYEDDNNGQGLVWMDYTNDHANWETQVAWAEGLNSPGALILSLNPGVAMDVEGNWRLPTTGDGTEHDYFQTTAEMGHLHYISLGNSDGLDAFQNSYPFENLHEPLKTFYWSGTEYPVLPEYYAWVFQFEYGIAGPGSKLGVGYGIAVLPADVNVVPIPGAVWLLASGLFGLVWTRRKFKK